MYSAHKDGLLLTQFCGFTAFSFHELDLIRTEFFLLDN